MKEANPKSPGQIALETKTDGLEKEVKQLKTNLEEQEAQEKRMRHDPSCYPGSDLSHKVEALHLEIERTKRTLHRAETRHEKLKKRLALGMWPNEKLSDFTVLKTDIEENLKAAGARLTEVQSSQAIVNESLEKLRLEEAVLMEYGGEDFKAKTTKSRNILLHQQDELERESTRLNAILAANDITNSLMFQGVDTPAKKYMQMRQELMEETGAFVSDIKREWDEQMSRITAAAENLKDEIRALGHIKAKALIQDKDLSKAGLPVTGLAGRTLVIDGSLKLTPTDLLPIFSQGESVGLA